MDLQLDGKKALIFGSTGGIGRAVAESLIKEGVEVFINGRTEENAKKSPRRLVPKALCWRP